ncbi:MAG: hypothetical protein M1503_00555 [Thaumarchaeota archaeon]|nr:hypothetical protein [Nitrososphaerota archaeon]
MHSPRITDWIKHEYVKDYETIGSEASTRVSCNECAGSIDSEHHYTTLHVLSEEGEWRDYKVCNGCITTVLQALDAVKT